MIESFNGKSARIAPTAFVSEAACVIGDVEIGENSSVWPGAIIRGDFTSIRIGNNCQIEDNCVVHAGRPVEIGDNVHIGHGAVVHCSRIGNNVLIGSNATLLDEAEIGDSCVVAANSVVGTGMRIPDDSFVAGVPAKIKGNRTRSQAAATEDGVNAYVRLARQYKREGL
ncbi:MAG: gamma carbonic anhydrase family protein [Chloroflexi bacterium]|nr:MAG: gamma carbonic anhydrase family protein [Chloroflexota bacterium]RLC96016.1 MAG: gamma carbonic anhydrase family protein [Chloroflexota bacterium]